MNDKPFVNVTHLALIPVWTALVLAVSVVPAYPVLGTTAVITLSSILFSSMTTPLLGLVGGTISGLIFGLLVPYVNPSTAIFGALTFLAPTLAALVGGLFLFNRWKEATLIFFVQLAIWFTHPFAWYEAMPIITWQYWLVLALIIIPPIRKWIINTIVTRNPKRLPIALWCLAWISRIGGDVITGNNIAVWLWGFGTPDLYAYWAPVTLYYAIAESLNCLAGALIGTAVLLSLKGSGIRITAIDFLHSKLITREK